MKNLFLFFLLVVLLFSESLKAQVNSVQVIPVNPVSTDSLKVISDFTYYGNCSFGLVSVYSSMVDSSILIIATYCGYGDSTLCNSIDTFTVGPYPAGNYSIQIQYHQGSVCPFSGFDAQIAQFDSLFSISQASSISSYTGNTGIRIYPNPCKDKIIIEDISAQPYLDYSVVDMFGRTLAEGKFSGYLITEDLAAGIYFLVLRNGNKIVQQKFCKQ